MIDGYEYTRDEHSRREPASRDWLSPNSLQDSKPCISHKQRHAKKCDAQKQRFPSRVRPCTSRDRLGGESIVKTARARRRRRPELVGANNEIQPHAHYQVRVLRAVERPHSWLRPEAEGNPTSGQQGDSIPPQGIHQIVTLRVCLLVERAKALSDDPEGVAVKVVTVHLSHSIKSQDVLEDDLDGLSVLQRNVASTSLAVECPDRFLNHPLIVERSWWLVWYNDG